MRQNLKLKEFGDEVDRRIGHRKLLHLALDEPIPGGASFAYVFGSAALILFLVQLGTGLVLATLYSPSTTDAWASIAYLEREVPFGAFVRGMHHHAAGGMVVVVGLHLLQTALYGAYKAPREANWLSGLALLAVVLGFALTGYLLPWDQTGYWATKVATSIAGTVPVIGGFAQKFLQGGNDYGNLTLTRFYALHAVLLPLVSVALIAGHIALFRRHGITRRARAASQDVEDQPTEMIAPKPAKDRPEPFWPRQVFYDALFACLVLATIAALAIKKGAPLEAPADPASSFLARPEWYFLFLFQLLKYYEGALEIVGTVVIPGAAATFLAAVPFLDRGPSRRVADRKPFIAAFALGVLAISGLTIVALLADAQDPFIAEQKAVARREAVRARELAKSGIPTEGAAAMVGRDPLVLGERIFRAECMNCHAYAGGAPDKTKAPNLTGYGTRAWIRQALRDPDSTQLFGNTKICGMKSFAKLDPRDLELLVDLIYSRRLPNAPAADQTPAAKLLEDHECANCHDFEGDSPVDGPALGGYGTVAWIEGVVRDASAEHRYGERNKMPKYQGKLSDAEITAVVRFVASLESWPEAQVWPWVAAEVPTKLRPCEDPEEKTEK